MLQRVFDRIMFRQVFRRSSGRRLTTDKVPAHEASENCDLRVVVFELARSRPHAGVTAFCELMVGVWVTYRAEHAARSHDSGAFTYVRLRLRTRTLL